MTTEDFEIESEGCLMDIPEPKAISENNNSEFELGKFMAGEDAENLIEELLTNRGSALTIDTSAVEKIDTACIEVLLSAAKLWAFDNLPFDIVGTSEPFSKSVEILGINFKELQLGGL